MSNDMNSTSYVPTNNQNPVVETPLATADQFPQPEGYVAPVADEPVDHSDTDTTDMDEALQQAIEAGRADGADMAVFGLDVPEPTDEELRALEQEYQAETRPAPKGKKK